MRHCLRAFSGPGRAPKIEAGFTQYRLAQRCVPRLCRLYGDGRIPKRCRATCRLANQVGPAVIMCAEAVWWRCHRALIADYLKTRGVEVTHIIDLNKAEPHPFTSAARLINGELSYPANDSLL